MIAKIVEFSILNRWLVLIVMAFMAVLGWQSFQSLPIDAIPDITNNQVQVNTSIEGMGPEEIERGVTFPIETVMNGIPGVTEVRSLTRYGLSQVTVVFEDRVSIYQARQLVSERLQSVADTLPQGASPKLGPVSSGLGEIYHYVIEADQIAQGEGRLNQLAELRSLQDWHIKPRLLSVAGVAEINVIGGFEKQYLIQPDPKKLKSLGLHFSDIELAIKDANQNFGGGYVEQTGEQFIVQGSGMFTEIEDIRSVALKVLENGRSVSVGDVSEVKVGRELRTGAAMHNGKESVVGTVLMLLGENSRQVSRRVDEKMNEIKKDLPEGYRIDTVYNRSDMVNATLSTVEHNLLMGATLVIVVLFFLIGNFRAALITAIVIPLSLLFTFIMMRRFGISGNLVSLGALDFGIIVDGTVIVLDNCVRHIHEKTEKLKRSLSKEEVKKTIYEATVEIRKSAGFGELVVIVVFLPIFAFVGVEGKMFIPMAATFIFALFGALIFSFTFVPAIASFILKGDVKDSEPWLMTKLSDIYEPFLEKILGYHRVVLGVAIVAILSGVVLFSRLGGEFLPQLNEGSIAIQFIRPTSAGLSHSLAFEEKSQKIIMSFPEVVDVFSRVGTGEVAVDPMGPNVSDNFITLKPMEDWPKVQGRKRTKAELIDDMVKELEESLPGQRLMVSQPVQLRFNELMEGTRADISLKIFGEEQQELIAAGEKIAEILKNISGAGDVEVESRGTFPVLDVRPKREVLKSLGVPAKEVLETVGVGLGGEHVGDFYEGMKRFPIVVRLKDEDRANLQTLKNLPVGVAGATMVPLHEVADLSFKDSFSSYNREQTKRRVAVLINLRGRDTESFVAEAQEVIRQNVELPSGSYLEWGGNFKNLEQAKKRLSVLGPLALALIALMIYAAFRKVWETALIFVCIPFALIGGVLALMIKGLPFSISAGVGFIALSGIAVLNGVVLVSYFNELQLRGMSGAKVALKGARLRLRPVLMTALVDIFGFLPMAMATGLGAEVQEPLATVVIGGIFSATLLTLIVLPVFYVRCEAFFEKR